MEADSRAAQVSQERLFKGELSFKGGAGIRPSPTKKQSSAVSWQGKKSGRNEQRENSGSNYDCGTKVGN